MDRLLGSIAAGRLVLLCGAGLSMGPPSNLPSAASVSERCFDRYAGVVGHDLPDGLRDNLELLAEHFSQNGQLSTLFLDAIVPWDAFVAPFNAGHAAVADFLLCGAAASAITTNYDRLVEDAASRMGAYMVAALDNDEANRTTTHGPLLKPHGCASIDRRNTVWAPSQLDHGVMAGRIASSQNWMRAHLREKDLLIIGFWSDWSYLNRIVANALVDAAPASITLVAPDETADLAAKAPQLWDVAHGPGVNFYHERAYGEAFLTELRGGFSRAWLGQMLRSARGTLQALTGTQPAAGLFEVAETDPDVLYSRRRDAEGSSPDAPARRKAPPDGPVLGLFHLLLRQAGAVESGTSYEFAGRRVRVVNGSNMILSTMRDRFKEPPSVQPDDIVACVGATSIGTPGNIVRTGRPRDLMRPSGSSNWLDFESARAELGI